MSKKVRKNRLKILGYLESFDENANRGRVLTRVRLIRIAINLSWKVYEIRWIRMAITMVRSVKLMIGMIEISNRIRSAIHHEDV